MQRFSQGVKTTMSATIRVPVTCFEITQNPEQKTDYFFSVHNAMLQPQEVDSWLWRLHASLASPVLPDEEVFICCPAQFSEKETGLYCVCRAKRIVPQNGGRDFLHFQVVFLELQGLMHTNVNPVALCHSDVWTSMGQHTNSALCAASDFGRANAKTSELARMITAQRQDSEITVQSLDVAITQTGQVFDQIGWHSVARICVAIGIPVGCRLPIMPSLTIYVKKPIPQSAAWKGQQRQEAPSRNSGLRPLRSKSSALVEVTAYRDYVAEIAEDACQHTALSPQWITRIWNLCQDALMWVELTDSSGFLSPHHERLSSAHQSLATEIRRSGVDDGEQATNELQRLWGNLNRARRPWWAQPKKLFLVFFGVYCLRGTLV